MRILYLEWSCFCNEDMKEAFEEHGHALINFIFDNKCERRDSILEGKLKSVMEKEKVDVVFSFNFFPLVSIVCHERNIPYVSWTYDNPLVNLYAYPIIYPTNHIYFFDSESVQSFINAGINTFHYLPMAANSRRLEKLAKDFHADKALQDKYTCDVSFVGSLYTEGHNFFDRMKDLDEHTKGYIDGLFNSQLQVSGVNFIEKNLTPVLEELKKALPLSPNPDGVETFEYLFAQYVLNRKLTGIERQRLIGRLAYERNIDFHLYTKNPDFIPEHANLVTLPYGGSLPTVPEVESISTSFKNRGTVDYYSQMPHVFCGSKINLNISLRSILSGIPLRAFDIMGVGGFLLSNYQSDYSMHFVAGEDYIYYEDENDFLSKIDYFLCHEKDRLEIAHNGKVRVESEHTFIDRVPALLSF